MNNRTVSWLIPTSVMKKYIHDIDIVYMPRLTTFLDMTHPGYMSNSNALLDNGWKKMHTTRGVSQDILKKYYEYLVGIYANKKGVPIGFVQPKELEAIYKGAIETYPKPDGTPKYEMYVKDIAANGNVNMGAAGGHGAVEEHFASPEDVARMQPGYVVDNDLSELFGRMGLGAGAGGWGGRRRKHRRSKSRRHTKRTKSKRRKTHRR